MMKRPPLYHNLHSVLYFKSAPVDLITNYWNLYKPCERLNSFYPHEIVSRYRDPTLQVGKKYLYLFISNKHQLDQPCASIAD